MISGNIPNKFPVVWASSADPGEITQPIPTPPQAGGRASLTIGWPDPTFQPLASGGNPPYGKDFNGIFYMITAWLQWINAGGPIPYDSTFQTAIGGYPKGALIQKASSDRYWLSTTENNITNPETGGAGWALFPDVIVQAQAGNWANDIGTSGTNYRVTLSPLPASLAAIKGSPIRFFASHANTVNAPTMTIDNVAGNGPVTIINSNGSVLSSSQIARSGQICEGFYDGTFFQLTSPGPVPGAGPTLSPAITGVIYAWAAETVPSWGLECNGAQVPIVSFPNLFNIIQFRYGGDGVNNFRLPDLRGAFMRGWDHGRGLDPNATTRTPSPFGTGGIAGDHVGSWEAASISAADLNNSTLTLLGTPNVAAGTPGFLNALAQFSNGALTPGDIHQSFPPGTLPWQGTNPMVTLFSGGDNFFGNAGGAGFGVSNCYGLQGQAFFSAGGIETRPINMDVMFVIAF